MEGLLAKSVLRNLARAVEKLALVVSFALEGGNLPHRVLDAFAHVKRGSMELHFQFTALEPELLGFLLAQVCLRNYASSTVVVDINGVGVVIGLF